MKIVLADNQQLTAAGLSSFLQERPDFEIAAHVSLRSQLEEILREHSPDLLIVDYNLNGFVTIEDLEKLTKENPALNILILSSDNEKSSILKVLQLGVKGYVTKECSKDEVLMAIGSASRGEKFFCHKILEVLMEKHFSTEAPSTEPAILTVRESEILTLIAKGRSSQQIADSLHLSPHTVQSHRKSIIRKLQIKSPTEFVIYAMDLGLMKPR
jgi:two-component system, NarL family, invasion response regulator UvrY